MLYHYLWWHSEKNTLETRQIRLAFTPLLALWITMKNSVNALEAHESYWILCSMSVWNMTVLVLHCYMTTFWTMHRVTNVFQCTYILHLLICLKCHQNKKSTNSLELINKEFKRNLANHSLVFRDLQSVSKVCGFRRQDRNSLHSWNMGPDFLVFLTSHPFEQQHVWVQVSEFVEKSEGRVSWSFLCLHDLLVILFSKL